MARQRLDSWLGDDSPAPAAGKRYGGPSDYSGLLSALRAAAPGQWSQNLTELSRHFTSASFLAVNTLATQASGSRFEVYERVDDEEAPNGKVALPWTDPIHELFEDPNDEDTFADFLYQTVQQLGLTGISLTWSPPSDDGWDEPAELYSLPSASAWPIPPSPQYPRGAYRVTPYPYGMYGGAPVGQIAAGAIIPAEQIKRIKNHHPQLRYDGYAVLSAIALQVDTLEGIDKSRFSTQQLGCDQTLTLEFDDETLDPDETQIERVRQQLQMLYMGPKNAGKLFICPPGTSLKKNSTTPAEMAWTEGWNQILDFVLACYGVPQAVAGLQANLSYATLYSSLRAFSLLSLGPLLDRIAGGWTKRLIRPAYGRKFGLSLTPPEFRDEALVESQVSNDLKCGVRLNREIRKLRGLDALDPAKYPWVNERATASAQPQGPEGGKENQPESNGPREEDPAVNNARPNNGAAGRMGKRNGHPRKALLNAFEKAKTNGHAHPIKV